MARVANPKTNLLIYETNKIFVKSGNRKWELLLHTKFPCLLSFWWQGRDLAQSSILRYMYVYNAENFDIVKAFV